MKRALLPVLLVLPLGACISAFESSVLYQGADSREADDDSYVRGPAPLKGVDFDALWSRAEWVLTMEGAGIDSDRTHYDQREMVTHWDTQLAPNRYEGRRSRAWIKFENPKPGEWNVAVSVQVQRNADLDAPSNIGNAKWEEREPNMGRANAILWKIESGFREGAKDEDEDAPK